jgi:hypothetical protein
MLRRCKELERNIKAAEARGQDAALSRVSVTFLRKIAGEGFSCLAFSCLTLCQQKNVGQENVFRSFRAKL